jgi:hypothetical protein
VLVMVVEVVRDSDSESRETLDFILVPSERIVSLARERQRTNQYDPRCCKWSLDRAETLAGCHFGLLRSGPQIAQVETKF